MLEPKAQGPSEAGPLSLGCPAVGQEEDDPFPSSPCEAPPTATPPPDDPPPQEEDAQPSVTDTEKSPPTPTSANEGEDCGGNAGGDGEIRHEMESRAEHEEEDHTDEPAIPSSSSSFIIPELRLDRSFSADALSLQATDEEYDDEEDEDEEEDSDEHCLEGGGRAEATPCEKHGDGLSVQNSLRRRTHSEGSLLQDPRPACFTSDNAINCLDSDTPHKGGWTLPSPRP
ncbi:hypothetical protein GJAV_G00029410 [Gymnothorax javanicus]|nr:hypothetical protein GJAV_G00029410 [Gymnothorax javanicus]